MKKMKLVMLLAFASLLLVACSRQVKLAKQISHAQHQTTTQNNVSGGTYHGTYTGNKSHEDPDYDYLMSFKKDGTFRQDITASNGYAGKFVESGTYQVNKKTQQIIIKIQKVVEVTYASDSALKQKATPTAYQYRDEHQLTAAENKPIEIKITPKYLEGSINKVKLYKVKTKVVDFDQFKTQQAKQYQSTPKVVAQKLIGGKNFMGRIDKNQVWLTFNQDGTFNWQAVYNSYGAGSVAYMTGQYHLDDQGHITFDHNQGDVYDMSQLSVAGNQYRDRSSVSVPDERFNFAVYDNQLIMRLSDSVGGSEAAYQTPDSGAYKTSTVMTESATKTPTYLEKRGTMTKVNPLISQFENAENFGKWALIAYRTPSLAGMWGRPQAFGIKATDSNVTQGGIRFAYLTTIEDVSPKDEQQIDGVELIGLGEDSNIYLNPGTGFIKSAKFTDYLNAEKVDAARLSEFDASVSYDD